MALEHHDTRQCLTLSVLGHKITGKKRNNQGSIVVVGGFIPPKRQKQGTIP